MLFFELLFFTFVALAAANEIQPNSEEEVEAEFEESTPAKLLSSMLAYAKTGEAPENLVKFKEQLCANADTVTAEDLVAIIDNSPIGNTGLATILSDAVHAHFDFVQHKLSALC